MTRQPRVLIAPLDWGLGHATRCVPLIKQYLREGYEVVLAGSGRSALLLKRFFPNLTLHEIPGYDVHYQEKGSFILHLLRQIPKIIRAVKAEHDWLNELLQREPFDLIISDNRFGLHTTRTRTVIITHQVFPSSPPLLRRLTYWQVWHYLRKFDECWVPDLPGDNNLSGSLAHGKMPLPVKYIGALSRFSNQPLSSSAPSDWPEVLALISGPEPQRSILQEKMETAFKSSGKRCWIVSGTPESEATSEQGAVKIFPHLDDQQMMGAILHAGVIFCRSGYSSLMDLHVLGKKAVLIPTPGQTEQEYLATHFRDRFGWKILSQDAIQTADLNHLIK